MQAEPENCPGVESESAGFSSACAGCPNQQICSDPNKPTVDPGKALVDERMKRVRNKLLILSGKGGLIFFVHSSLEHFLMTIPFRRWQKHSNNASDKISR